MKSWSDGKFAVGVPLVPERDRAEQVEPAGEKGGEGEAEGPEGRGYQREQKGQQETEKKQEQRGWGGDETREGKQMKKMPLEMVWTSVWGACC